MSVINLSFSSTWLMKNIEEIQEQSSDFLGRELTPRALLFLLGTPVALISTIYHTYHAIKGQSIKNEVSVANSNEPQSFRLTHALLAAKQLFAVIFSPIVGIIRPDVVVYRHRTWKMVALESVPATTTQSNGQTSNFIPVHLKKRAPANPQPGGTASTSQPTSVTPEKGPNARPQFSTPVRSLPLNGVFELILKDEKVSDIKWPDFTLNYILPSDCKTDDASNQNPLSTALKQNSANISTDIEKAIEFFNEYQSLRTQIASLKETINQLKPPPAIDLPKPLNQADGPLPPPPPPPPPTPGKTSSSSSRRAKEVEPPPKKELSEFAKTLCTCQFAKVRFREVSNDLSRLLFGDETKLDDKTLEWYVSRYIFISRIKLEKSKPINKNSAASDSALNTPIKAGKGNLRDITRRTQLETKMKSLELIIKEIPKKSAELIELQRALNTLIDELEQKSQSFIALDLKDTKRTAKSNELVELYNGIEKKKEAIDNLSKKVDQLKTTQEKTISYLSTETKCQSSDISVLMEAVKAVLDKPS